MGNIQEVECWWQVQNGFEPIVSHCHRSRVTSIKPLGSTPGVLPTEPTSRIRKFSGEDPGKVVMNYV